MPGATHLASQLEALLVNDADYVYPPTDLHLTVVNVDASLGHMSAQTMVARLVEALAMRASPRIEIHGLGVSRHTVFARVVAVPSLGRLRRQIRRALGLGWPSWRPADEVAFINLLRFRAQHDRRIVEAVRGLADQQHPAWDLNTLELVTTDKVLSLNGTRLLAEIPFGAPEGMVPTQ
jgi:hypothetical protein